MGNLFCLEIYLLVVGFGGGARASAAVFRPPARVCWNYSEDSASPNLGK